MTTTMTTMIVRITKPRDDQIAIIKSCNVMSHLCQGGINATIWLPTFFPLVYEIIYSISLLFLVDVLLRVSSCSF